MTSLNSSDHGATEDQTQSDQVKGVYRDLDRKTEAFKKASGLKCLEGCGRCCLFPQVEATPGEWLPLALHLVENGGVDAVYQEAQKSLLGSCSLYQKDANDPTKGSCSVYPHRPSICRLFGFSSLKKKDGQKELLTCRTIKDSISKTLERPLERPLEKPLNISEAPTCQEFQGKINGLFGTHPTLSVLLPINQALCVALEYVGLRRAYGVEESSGILEFKKIPSQMLEESASHLERSPG